MDSSFAGITVDITAFMCLVTPPGMAVELRSEEEKEKW